MGGLAPKGARERTGSRKRGSSRHMCKARGRRKFREGRSRQQSQVQPEGLQRGGHRGSAVRRLPVSSARAMLGAPAGKACLPRLEEQGAGAARLPEHGPLFLKLSLPRLRETLVKGVLGDE